MKKLLLMLCCLVGFAASAAEYTDVITLSGLGLTPDDDGAWKTIKTTTFSSPAVYAGYVYADDGDYFGFASTANRPFYTTTSGGRVKSISFVVVSGGSTAGLKILGKNEPYTSANEPYSTVEADAGTVIGTYTYSASNKEVTITPDGDYTYIAMYGAAASKLYISSMTIVWEDVASEPETATDVLNATVLGLGTSYSTVTGKTATDGSGAEYTCLAMTNANKDYIQVNTSKSSVLFNTTTPGNVRKIVVTYSSQSNTKVLDFYGSNTAITAADLYATTVPYSSLGSLTASANGKDSIVVEGDFAYIGIRPNNGVVYPAEIAITWEKSGTTPDPQPVKVETPTFSPVAGTYAEAQNVTISCATDGSTIYYTTDGTEPTAASTEYTAAIPVAESMTIKAIAVKADCTDSDVATAEYVINISTGDDTEYDYYEDVISLESLGLKSSSNEDSWKTFADKTFVSEAAYAGRVGVGDPDYDELKLNSSTASIVTTKSGGYIKKITINFNSECNDNNSLVLYGKDDAYEAYTDAFDADKQGTQIGTWMCGDGRTQSYDIDGKYANIAICGNAQIYVTSIAITWGVPKEAAPASDVITADNLDLGSAYATTSAVTYASGAAYVANAMKSTSNGEIQMRSSNNNSGIVCAKSAGKVTKVTVYWGQSQTTDRTVNVYGRHTAYYNPTQLYKSDTDTTGVLVGTMTASKGTVTSVTFTDGFEYFGLRSAGSAIYADSIVVEWNGTSEPPMEQVETPKFSVEPGTYTAAQSVELSCDTEGAAIYYTVDGSDPSATSTAYTEAIPVSETTTIKAIAVKEGWLDSEIATATYVISADDSTTITWKIVTSAGDLKEGDEVIIAASEYNFAMSTTQNNNNRGQAAITKNDDGSELDSPSADVAVFQLVAGTVDNSWAFSFDNAGTTNYLYASSSSSNQLKSTATLNDNASATIVIADSVATVTFQGTNSRNIMQYNASSSLFACYSTASQKALVIYKKYVEKTGIDAVGADTEEVDAEPVYYNLQGVRVAAPAHGIYIEVRGTRARKVAF